MWLLSINSGHRTLDGPGLSLVTSRTLSGRDANIDSTTANAPAGAAASVCALAHPCAAERRLTVTGPCVHRRLHTSISCPFQVIQSGSHRNFIRNFVYARMAPLDQCGSIVHHPSPANDLFKRIWQEHTRRLHYLVTTPGRPQDARCTDSR